MTKTERPTLPLNPDAPLHGFQGDRGATPATPAVPASLVIAISREAGARGGTIGRRVAKNLGWQLYNQEMLEYTAQEGASRHVMMHLPQAAARWAEDRLQQLLREQNLSQHPSVADLARIVLALGAQGEVVLIGRGAGSILPSESTLHIRVIAPLEDRVAYMSQWLRLTEREAEEQVRQRDEGRTRFIETHFRRHPGDPYQYDLILNSSLLGEETSADLIAKAARAKLAAWRGLSPD
ncbi:MAG TPA: cytidylate kinase-like family protein [Gemmataceae bacterium]|nr:cytidylate kinase-like family protein [Gemmataceae bacterium]